MCTALADTCISAIGTISFGIVSIGQLVEVTDSAVLGGVVEVVSSIPAMDHKIFFSICQIIGTVRFYSAVMGSIAVMPPKDADGMATV